MGILAALSVFIAAVLIGVVIAIVIPSIDRIDTEKDWFGEV